MLEIEVAKNKKATHSNETRYAEIREELNKLQNKYTEYQKKKCNTKIALLNYNSK